MKKSKKFLFHGGLIFLGLCLLGQIGVSANYSSSKMSFNNENPSTDNNVRMYSGVNYSASGDSIADAILKENSIPVQFENDSVYPWIINGNQVESGNREVKNSTSYLKFSYDSNYKTEISFDIWKHEATYNYLYYYVDGRLQKEIGQYSQHERFYIPKGKHLIEIKDSISDLYTYNGAQYGCISNLCIREIFPIEQIALSPNSKPIVFENDDEYPWTTEDGYIQNSNYNHNYSTSRFSTTFTIDTPHKISFDADLCKSDGDAGYDSYHNLKFYVNGYCYKILYGEKWTQHYTLFLKPGKYHVEWVDSITDYHTDFYSKIKNIELSNNWINVELASPGTLGVEVLYKVNVLNDVELLKVKGILNEADWENIRQMKNLIALDLTEAKFNGIPNDAFKGLGWLYNVKLPEGIKYIGDNAFKDTRLDHIFIPSTVETIGRSSFYATPIRNITFDVNSNLKTIKAYAFENCSKLSEFIMPKTVTMLENYNTSYSNYYGEQFSGCTSLKKIIFSDSLKFLPSYTCRECDSLSEVHLPNNLESIHYGAFRYSKSLRNIKFPSTINSIHGEAFLGSALDSVSLPVKMTILGYQAFSYCENLKYLELPSYLDRYDRFFSDCTSIKKVVCKSATPPIIEDDPFYGVYKENITLVVPSFAVVNYKLDKYWYQFGEILEGDDIDYWKVAGDLSLTNNRRMNGKPDIDLYYGGKLSIGGNAPFTALQMNFFVSDDNPCRLLNMCEALSADSVNTYYKVEDNKWYFFTPLYDVDVKDINVSNDASYVFRYFNAKNRAEIGAGNSWRNVVSEKLIAGQGYIFHCNKDCIITFPAKKEVHSQVFEVNDKTIPLVINESSTMANKNWNYVGNPYPCYYDIYYIDFTAPITVWTGSTYLALSIVDDEYVLRPMQSFFVQKPEAVKNIKFNPAGKQISSTVNRASYALPKFSGVNDKRYVFNITIGKDSVEDRTRVVLNENRSLKYEMECDASKFMSMNTEVSQIYTIGSNNDRLSINERPESDGKVKLGFYASAPGAYNISVEHADGEIFIYDNETKTESELTEEGYSFNVSESGTYENRFVLRFIPIYQDVTYISDASDQKININVDNRTIMVSGSDNAEISLYTVSGRLLSSDKGMLKKTVNAGVYLVVVDGESYKVVVS